MTKWWPISRTLEIAAEVAEALAGVVPAAYNAGFDRGFILAEFERAGLGREQLPPSLSPSVESMNPLVWARELHEAEKSKSLGEVSARLGIALETAHRATDDAEAALRVLYAFRRTFVFPRDMRRWPKSSGVCSACKTKSVVAGGEPNQADRVAFGPTGGMLGSANTPRAVGLVSTVCRTSELPSWRGSEPRSRRRGRGCEACGPWTSPPLWSKNSSPGPRSLRRRSRCAFTDRSSPRSTGSTSPARWCSRRGSPKDVDAFSVSRACATSIQAMTDAAQAITAGHHDVAIVGGADSMSDVPLGVSRPLRDALMTAQKAKTLPDS